MAMLVFVARDVRSRTNTCAIATFRRYEQAMIGYPNDEAWSGHRYFDVGRWTYGILEVMGLTGLTDWWSRIELRFPPRRVRVRPDISSWLAMKML